MLRVTTLAALSIIAATSAVAGPRATSAPVPNSTDQLAAQEKKICRTEVSTGSIMAKRTCHTQAEWAAMGADNDRKLKEMRDWQRNDQMVQGSHP